MLFGRDAPVPVPVPVREWGESFLEDGVRAPREGMGLGRGLMGLLGTTTFSTRTVGGAVWSFAFWPKSPMTARVFEGRVFAEIRAGAFADDSAWVVLDGETDERGYDTGIN